MTFTDRDAAPSLGDAAGRRVPSLRAASSLRGASSPRGGSSLRRVAAVAATALLWLAAPVPASAHDVLLESLPADGEELASSPESIVLTFNNAPQPQYAQVVIVDAAEEVLLDVEPSYDGRVVTTPIETPLPAGELTVMWRVVSSDSHPIEGSFAFTVSTTVEPEGSGPEGSTPDGSTSDGSAGSGSATSGGTGGGGSPTASGGTLDGGEADESETANSPGGGAVTNVDGAAQDSTTDMPTTDAPATGLRGLPLWVRIVIAVVATGTLGTAAVLMFRRARGIR